MLSRFSRFYPKFSAKNTGILSGFSSKILPEFIPNFIPICTQFSHAHIGNTLYIHSKTRCNERNVLYGCLYLFRLKTSRKRVGNANPVKCVCVSNSVLNSSAVCSKIASKNSFYFVWIFETVGENT